MSRKKKTRNYKVTGTVEVYNITPGQRNFTKLDFDDPKIIENIEYSGSIVIKSSIYDTDATEIEEIFSDRSCDEG